MRIRRIWRIAKGIIYDANLW